MTEGITIALITALGSLLGGIIGQTIVAYATIKAAAMKGNGDQAISQPAIEPKGSKNSKIQGFWIGTLITATVIIFFFKVTGYIPPISFGEKFVSKLIIPSNNNQGFTYNIPDDGVYTFRYSDSAVSGWPDDDPNVERWHATISCFRGNEVKWKDTGVDFNFILFELGTRESYKTREATIKASIGQKATAGFRANEQITCVIADGQYDFWDNSGEVIMDVFVSP
jgi:hypothetical protein